ncbi:MAG: glycine/betaine ABC transporter substrate-binding protein [Oscillospiraceae bacterium]|nr:glycine/betaine ABC transporter substrate-binding protein [Oscillospiraceae bacterium]MBQ9045832.1 glycine/betaine ABC transporter substrate-binding protein [Oscillospiraceae bacterium]
MKKSITRVLSLLLTLVLLTGALAGCASKSGGSEAAVVIGSKDFSESQILAEIYALALEDAGIPVERKLSIANSAVHTAITTGEIDLYPEYTGTGLLAVLKLPVETDPQKVYDIVKEQYQEQFDVVWLDYAQANDGQGLVITTAASEEYGIKTISDLQKHATELRFASQGEFDEREDGLPALIATYGPFDWKSSAVYEYNLRYQILSSGEADVAPAATTEGQLIEDEFTLLEDDKQVWPPYNIAPIIRAEVLEAHPEIADVLNKISALIDTETITQLNYQVDVEKQEYDEVAQAFYDSIKGQL